VLQLPADQYFGVNWMQCLYHYFQAQPPSLQRTMRSSISNCELHDLTAFGFTVEQLTAALTITPRLPKSVRDENAAVNFERLGF